jgi:bifunctional UDP-N-acetylglucosamine pyrophosphorylase/glucosamine-1-phosphate N-acetyltransferase
MKTGVVILAAGQGTRMKSALPKVIHDLAGRPLIKHVIDTAKAIEPDKIIVVHGHGGETVKETIIDDGLHWVEQAQQLGTGHAVEQALPALEGVDKVLVLYGDVPLIKSSTLNNLLGQESALSILTVKLADPTGYGRIVRDANGQVLKIVEHKDASEDQLKIDEINTGILAADFGLLKKWIDKLDNNNSQKEFYLTDIISLAADEGIEVRSANPETDSEVTGINDRVQLAELERLYQKEQATELMKSGVTIRDPSRIDIRGDVKIDTDTEIDINVILQGQVTIGKAVKIGANTVIKDSHIADGVNILENCVIENAAIGSNSKLGPFSRIRPGTNLQGENHVGNFVEIKNSDIGIGSKINHLSYIGDSEVGQKVNVGAGTITCNYDGAYKHKTIIGDQAFIGSNTALVAPVTINQGSTIGAGSVITRETPADQLTLSRSKQITINNWQRPVKQKKDSG